MATTLNFKQDGSKYIYDFVSSGAVTIQVERDEKKDFTVYAFIDNLTPVPLFTTSTFEDLIFLVDVPEGVNVRLISWCPVVSAKMI